MIFEIEFLCSDFRPLVDRDEHLVDFLKPLHEKNEIVLAPFESTRPAFSIWSHSKKEKSSYIPFYRNVGILNTKKNSKSTYFKACRSIKFPMFEKHKFALPLKDYDCSLYRKDHLRRFWTVKDYGVTNRLKIGFAFEVDSLEDQTLTTDLEQKKTYELLKLLLEMPVKVKPNKVTIPLSELLQWMAKTITNSTKCKVKYRNSGSIHPDVEKEGATAVLLYNKGELKQLPRDTREFKIPNNISDFRISYYDYEVKAFNDQIRVYFIEYQDGVAEDFLHKLKDCLLKQRANYTFLHNMLLKTGIPRIKHRGFVDSLVSELLKVKNDRYFGCIDLDEQDCGEVFDLDRRLEIENELLNYNLNC